MIDDLIANGRYKEALDYLEDMEDEQVRYLRLICLYGLQNYQEGLKEATAAKMLANDTYYDVLCYYIYFLRETQQFEQAVNTLVEELSMPYIPYEYESKLNEVYDELLLQKKEAMAVYEGKNRLMSEEELVMYLQKGGSEEMSGIAIDELANRNIRRYMAPIRQLLQDDSRDSYEKSLILELLKEQEVDEDLVIRKHGHTIDANPIYLETVLESDYAYSISEALQNVLEDENPSLLEMCLEFLTLYLYDWYPMLEMIEDTASTACAIHYYLASISMIDCDLEDLIYAYGADEYEVSQICESITKNY